MLSIFPGNRRPDINMSMLPKYEKFLGGRPTYPDIQNRILVKSIYSSASSFPTNQPREVQGRQAVSLVSNATGSVTTFLEGGKAAFYHRLVGELSLMHITIHCMRFFHGYE